MKTPLTPLEARVIGCLLEKQVTTPEQYPLSLNALTNACNQKSNRDPLLSLSEIEVQAVVDALLRKLLVMEKSGFGGRVPKYQQRFCNLEFSELKFTPLELAIVCELLVRGPQTPGELRTRAGRMAEVRDVAEVEAALDALAARQPHPLVARLAREPGRRDQRWIQLFTGPVESAPDDPVQPESHAPVHEQADGSARVDRLSVLEDEVRELRRAVEELQRVLAARPTP